MQTDTAFKAWWTLNDGSILTLIANLGPEVKGVPEFPGYPPLHQTACGLIEEMSAGRMPPWSAAWFLGK